MVEEGLGQDGRGVVAEEASQYIFPPVIHNEHQHVPGFPSAGGFGKEPLLEILRTSRSHENQRNKQAALGQ
jgi:hypothetical protein